MSNHTTTRSRTASLLSVDGAPAGTGPASAIPDQELRDTKKKLSATLEVQAQLEMDVVELANQVSVLQGQLKDLRKSKHGLEEALSQEQMTYINEKQQWLDKEAESEATIVKLKEELAGNKGKKDPEQQQQLAPAQSAAASVMGAFSFPKFGRAKDMSIETAQHPEGSPTASTFTRGHSRLLSIGSLKETVASPSTSTASTAAATKEKDKTIERLKNELEQVQQQTEMVSREYSLRHEKIELELTQTKAMVSRLMEENEGFQFLLAEKAILGGFAASNDMSDSTTTTITTNANATNTTNDHTINDDTKDDDDNDDAATAIEQAAPPPHTTPGELKKRIFELEFETKSVRNHNKALTLSLERLVQRLLEYKDFERVVETQGMSGNINTKTIGSFQARMGSTASQGMGVGGGQRSTNLVGRHPGDRSSVMSDMGYFGASGGGGGSSSGSSTLAGGERKGHGRNRGSMSSLMSLPPNAVGGRPRPIKNPATWNNLLLGGSGGGGAGTAEGLDDGILTSGSLAGSGGASGTTTVVDRNSSIVSSSNASSASPLASPIPFRPDSPAVSSVSSLEEHHQQQQQQHSLAAALVGAADELMRRPSTSGQKKLRPLTMGV